MFYILLGGDVVNVSAIMLLPSIQEDLNAPTMQVKMMDGSFLHLSVHDIKNIRTLMLDPDQST